MPPTHFGKGGKGGHDVNTRARGMLEWGMGRTRKKEYDDAEASPIPLSIATATLSSDALLASRSLESEELVSPLSHSASASVSVSPARSPLPGLSVCPPLSHPSFSPSPFPCRTRPRPSLTSPYFIPSPPPSLRPSARLSLFLSLFLIYSLPHLRLRPKQWLQLGIPAAADGAASSPLSAPSTSGPPPH